MGVIYFSISYLSVVVVILSPSEFYLCSRAARQPPGLPSQHPITPPEPDPPEPPASAGGLLSVIVGCVLGVMVLILLAFIAMCLWRNRQQNSMHSESPHSCTHTGFHWVRFFTQRPDWPLQDNSSHPCR